MGLFSDDPEIEMVDTRTPEQKRLSGMLAPYLMANIGKGLPMYRGRRVAGMTPYERLSLAQLSGFQRMAPRAIRGAYLAGSRALAPSLAGELSTEISPELTERYFRESIYDPMYKSMVEDIIPEIEGEYAGNYWGTTRTRAQEEAWGDFSDTMTSTLADLVYRDEQTRIALEESAAQRQQASAAMVPDLLSKYMSAATAPLAAGQTFGALPRMIQQARLDTGYEEWLRTRPEYSPFLQYALSFMGTPGLTPTVSGGGSTDLGSLLSIGALLGSAYLMGGGFGGGGGVTGPPPPLVF